MTSERNRPGTEMGIYPQPPGLSRIERDRQERWNAFLMVAPVARAAEHPSLGRKAAAQIMEYLNGIHTGRFGRERKIRNAISTWIRWLRDRSGFQEPEAGKVIP